MKWRKNKLFKIAVLVSVIIFSWQCSSISTGSLITSEEKINEQIINGYQLGIEKIKQPSSQAPALEYKLEYKLVKFPMNQAQVINTYERVKTKHSKPMLWGLLLGGGIGFFYGLALPSDSEGLLGRNGKVIVGTLGLGLYGLIAGRLIKGKAFNAFGGEKVIDTDNPIIRKEVFFEANKSFSTPVPNFPVNITWSSLGKQGTYETTTDENGVISVHASADLKLSDTELKAGVEFTLSYLDNKEKRTYHDWLEIKK